MDILEILRSRGVDLDAKIKFLRHQGDKGLVRRMLDLGFLEEYQSFQKKFFDTCEIVVAFVGDGSSQARFYGIYRVQGSSAVGEIPVALVEAGHPQFLDESYRRYELTEIEGFEDLKDRLVIDWGKGALAWHQWASPKEVVQILPAGHVRFFPGYLDFVLTFDELCMMVAHPEANREWKTLLKAVAGVYLIVDSNTGQQYVGSAYGEEGVWGRWTQYSKTGHGGNKQLMDLMEGQPEYAQNFRFTLLRTLPRTLTNHEVISYESLYKVKLGTRAFGLNSN